MLKKASPDGVTAPGNALGPFKPEAELTNGRGAMVGLVALVFAESLRTAIPLFYRTRDIYTYKERRTADGVFFGGYLERSTCTFLEERLD